MGSVGAPIPINAHLTWIYLFMQIQSQCVRFCVEKQLIFVHAHCDMISDTTHSQDIDYHLTSLLLNFPSPRTDLIVTIALTVAIPTMEPPEVSPRITTAPLTVRPMSTNHRKENFGVDIPTPPLPPTITTIAPAQATIITRLVVPMVTTTTAGITCTTTRCPSRRGRG